MIRSIPFRLVCQLFELLPGLMIHLAAIKD